MNLEEKIKDDITILKNIENLNKKTILNIGGGGLFFEKYLIKNNLAKHITSIDRSNNEVIIQKEFQAKLEYQQVDFITHNFKKKYDILIFINSIQFILEENPTTIDKKYLDYIKNKILGVLKQNGYIYIKVTNKKWFQENKPQAPKYFLDSLKFSIDNSLKIFKEMKLIHKKIDEYNTYLLFQKK
jgi:hypothetical protein